VPFDAGSAVRRREERPIVSETLREPTPPLSGSGLVRRAWREFTRHVDPKMAVAGAAFLGGAVFAINYVEHGVLGASTAAAKQALYTFFVGGFVTRTCERISVRGERRWLSVAAGVAAASAIAFALTFLLHSLRGTPEPLLSMIPTVLSAPPALAVWGLRKRRQQRGEER